MAGVSAIHDREESAIIAVEFTYGESNSPDPLIARTELKGNYPNPFNPETTINFSTLSDNINTEIVVFNIKGQKVSTLLNEQISVGNHAITWQGTDDQGNKVTSGIYFYQMISGDYSSIQKMILMK